LEIPRSWWSGTWEIFQPEHQRTVLKKIRRSSLSSPKCLLQMFIEKTIRELMTWTKGSGITSVHTGNHLVEEMSLSLFPPNMFSTK
jgi:hypothetical protein